MGVVAQAATAPRRVSLTLRLRLARSHVQQTIKELAVEYVKSAGPDSPPPAELADAVSAVRELRAKNDAASRRALAGKLAELGTALAQSQGVAGGAASTVLQRLRKAQADAGELDAELARMGDARALRVIVAVVALLVAAKILLMLIPG
jgi:hypothetical protein